LITNPWRVLPALPPVKTSPITGAYVKDRHRATSAPPAIPEPGGGVLEVPSLSRRQHRLVIAGRALVAAIADGL